MASGLWSQGWINEGVYLSQQLHDKKEKLAHVFFKMDISLVIKRHGNYMKTEKKLAHVCVKMDISCYSNYMTREKITLSLQ